MTKREALDALFYGAKKKQRIGVPRATFLALWHELQSIQRFSDNAPADKPSLHLPIIYKDIFIYVEDCLT